MANAQLYPLLCTRSKLSLGNKLLIYKTLLRPVISYVSPVWGAAASTHVKKLQTLQNATARQITTATWFFRNKNIQKDLKLTPIEEFFQKLSTKYYHKLGTSTNETVKEMPVHDTRSNRTRRRPRALLHR
ncbi:hypothetical protein AVEN_251419-1 [Araneus ventricosus]|uniref:RNA-directed DNA polymerase from transposon X-element n=1 Tax=Araneus ventricosus TaxID=182803 RepID=A0A4Y2MHG2_ARAVE|nr:hypothetical protein AVEN_251419-1 [Araneus ventricosus]